MRILLTNDDGIFAPGLAAIYKKLIEMGDVTVVAPANSMSGASHSFTFEHPFACNKVNINNLFDGFSVEGSPADCVKIAVLELIEEPFDLIVSGINNGENAGVSVYYSGTVAAAMEGVFLKVPSIALSLTRGSVENPDFDQAADLSLDIIQKLMPLSHNSVVNINIPDLSKGKPKGVKVVPQSTDGFEEHYKQHKTSDGTIIFQLAGGHHRYKDDTTDTVALSHGYITLTALSPGMTDYEKTNELKNIQF